MIVPGPGVFISAKVCADIAAVLPIGDLRVKYRERLGLYEALTEIAAAALAYEQRVGSAQFRPEVPVRPLGAEPDAPSRGERDAPPERWHTGQVASHVGVSASAVRRAARQRRLPGIATEHGWVFDPSDVAAWVRGRAG